MEYTGNDFYCDVAIKNTGLLQLEYLSNNVIAFKHTRPTWPCHIVVVPKKHIESFTDINLEDEYIFNELLRVVRQIAKKIEAEFGGARIITNLGKYQDSKHLHFHVCSGEPLPK